MLIHSSQYWFTFKRSLDWEKTSVMLWLTSSMSYYIVHVHQFFLFCVQRFNTSGVSTHNNVQCGCSTYSTRLALPRPNDLCTAFRPPPLSSGKSSGTTTGSLDRKRINSIDQWSCFQFCKKVYHLCTWQIHKQETLSIQQKIALAYSHRNIENRYRTLAYNSAVFKSLN